MLKTFLEQIMDLSLSIPLAPRTDSDFYPEEIMEGQGTPAQTIFFQKLHSMITNESHTGYIEWLPGHNGFVIPFKQIFSDNVLPRYFGKAKYSSFTRRLKRWGFRRVRKFVSVLMIQIICDLKAKEVIICIYIKVTVVTLYPLN